MRHLLAALVAIAFFGLPWLAYTYPEQSRATLSFLQDVSDQLAAVVLSHKPKTVADIQSHYKAAEVQPTRKVKILIVPGHEPGYGGSEYGKLKEREMTVEFSNYLAGMLRGNSHYEVFVSRDDTAWAPALATYFKDGMDDIVAWQKASREETSHLVSIGAVSQTLPPVLHNDAPKGVAMRLFGMTKWANENDIDITIHVHFNDNPGHKYNKPGDHSGFAIYVPASQFGNSATTKTIAEKIFNRLSKYNAVSDLPGESTGIIDEPELIAIGVNNTADAASMLIEYGYIYEPQFTKDELRPTAMKDLAFQTYLGLQDFFESNTVLTGNGNFDTSIFPHRWDTTLSEKTTAPVDIYALQTALVQNGFYPPASRTKNDCPRTGTLGPCTRQALDAFQKKYSIVGEQGMVGPKTQAILNQLYSLRTL